MSEPIPQRPGRPFHLNAPSPAHIRLRPDLVEELCIAEAFDRTLPRTQLAHARWTARWGCSVDKMPIKEVERLLGSSYKLTERFVLRPAILHGSDWLQNVVTDGRGWSVCTELGGLYEFAINRAAQFVTTFGTDFNRARAQFYPKADGKRTPGPRFGCWALGYDRATGFGTILWPGEDQTLALYLAGKPGYLVPNFPDAAGPSCRYEL